MKALFAATVVAAIALMAAAPARADSGISVQLVAPQFALRLGAAAPGPAAVYVPPVPLYVSAPVVVAAPPVVYLPPRVLVAAPVLRPVVYPYGGAAARWHGKHGHHGARRAVVHIGGYGRW